jgi:hypothetical protein
MTKTLMQRRAEIKAYGPPAQMRHEAEAAQGWLRNTPREARPQWEDAWQSAEFANLAWFEVSEFPHLYGY